MNIVHIMNISIYKFSSDSNGQWSIFINNLNWKPIVVKNLIEQTLYKLFVHPLETCTKMYVKGLLTQWSLFLVKKINCL